MRNDALVVNDATQHPLVCENSAVKDLGVMAYLGVPIRSADGEVLGSLCTIRTRPTEWTEADKRALQEFAGIVEDAIALRSLAELAGVASRQNETLARENHHRVKNVLSVAGSLLRMSSREASSINDLVAATEGRFSALAEAHDALLEHRDDVDLGALLRRLLAPYQSAQSCIGADSPAVSLKFKQITPIALIIHELATNSTKYGAIRTGRAWSLQWTVKISLVTLSWHEATSAPQLLNTSDNKLGFGSKLISLAAAQLNATISTTSVDPLNVSITFTSN